MRILAALVATAIAIAANGQEWKVVAAKGVQMSLPKAWKTIDMGSKDFERAIEAGVAGDERLRSMLPQVRQMRQAGDFRIFAFSGYVSGGFAENVNLLYERLPSGAAWKDWVQGSRLQMGQLARPGSLSGGETALGGRTMARFVWEMDAALPNGGKVRLALRTYAWKDGRGVWVATFTTLPARMKALAPIADRAAASIRSR